MRRVVDQTIRMRDVRAAYGVLQDLSRLITQIALPAVLVGFLEHHQQQFGHFKWRNVTAAKQLLNQGMEMANNNPDWENVRQICISIINLLPIEEQEKVQL
jgi:molecular chaperone DnaK